MVLLGLVGHIEGQAAAEYEQDCTTSRKGSFGRPGSRPRTKMTMATVRTTRR